MPKETKIDGEEIGEVAGGLEPKVRGFYGSDDWVRIAEEARKRGTCEKCGKKFEEAKHKKKSNVLYPNPININAQRWCEINWCGDCIVKYLGNPLPFVKK